MRGRQNPTLLISLRKLPKKYFRGFGIYRSQSPLKASFFACPASLSGLPERTVSRA
jgi:hypothetical protein